MPSSHNAPPATLDCALEIGPDDWRGGLWRRWQVDRRRLYAV